MIELARLTTDQRERLAHSALGDLRPSEVPYNWEQIIAGQAVLDAMWRNRPCFVCAKPGRCPHREPEADMAELAAIERRLRSAGVIL